MAAPLALDGQVCWAGRGGELVLTDFDGQALWRYTLGASCHSAPVAAGGLLVVGADDGRVYGFREQK